MATLEQRKAEYDAHKEAGYDFYNTIRSELSLALEGNGLSLTRVLDIQSKMEPVKNELIWGDWKNALAVVQGIVPNENLTREFIDRIQTEISRYINNNYTW